MSHITFFWPADKWGFHTHWRMICGGQTIVRQLWVKDAFLYLNVNVAFFATKQNKIESTFVLVFHIKCLLLPKTKRSKIFSFCIVIWYENEKELTFYIQNETNRYKTKVKNIFCPNINKRVLISYISKCTSHFLVKLLLKLHLTLSFYVRLSGFSVY